MSARRLIVLTGASRGLGAALAHQLLEDGVDMLTLARRPDTALRAPPGATLEQWSIDLSDSHSAAARLENWLEQRAARELGSATLINNAGLFGRAAPIDEIDSATLADVMRVDLETPLVLAAAFLRATRAWPVDKRVLNISSGAAQRPIAGWAAYCAAKAGLDHMTRVVALDEAARPNPARVVSLAPGVIDTDMQAELRSDASEFPDKPRFVQMKQAGELLSADEAAARVIAYLRRPDFGTQPVADTRQG